MVPWAGPLAGIVALGSSLATAELLSAVRGGGSPVLQVGDRVVDLVPDGVRRWAISAFGTSDKSVLLLGVLLVLVGLAALAGNLMVHGRRGAAVAVVVAVVVLGALSSLGRNGSGPAGALSTLASGAVGVLVLWFLADRAPEEVPATEPGPAAEPLPGGIGPMPAARPKSTVSRRGFLGAAAGVGALSLLGAGVAARIRSGASATAERLRIALPRPRNPLPPIPEDVSVGLRGVAPFVTPNADFYRIDTALVPPQVGVEDWTLKVMGAVEHPLEMDYRHLLARPMIELDATITCVSNEIGGDLIGTARWLGCRLDDLLAEAGVHSSADQVIGRSVDGFTAGFPTRVLDGRDAIVAVGMNGEPLPVEHGYPARLVVPGLYGYVSATKWLSEIELTRFDEQVGYWVPRGWDREAPVITMSRIDVPRDGATVTADRPVAVGGVAWAPVRGVKAVEVRVDDGPWMPADMGADHAVTTWRQWRREVRLDAGDHTLSARAIDDLGGVQSGTPAEPGPNAATGYHTVRVTAE